MKIKKVLLDMDGVIVDWVKGALKLRGLKDPYKDKYNYGKDLAKALNLEHKQIFLGQETTFWEHLPWMKDGKKILETLEERFGEENICLCSCPSKNYGSLTGKYIWTERNLPTYVDRLMLIREKWFAAGPKTLLIDDKPKNVELFQFHGGKSILIDREWNNVNYDGKTIEKFIADLDNIK